MSIGDPSSSNTRTFWDWFLLGALFGVVYSLIRNPGGCACCAGCLALLFIVLLVVLFALILDHLVLIAVAVLAAAALRLAWPHIRTRYL